MSAHLNTEAPVPAYTQDAIDRYFHEAIYAQHDDAITSHELGHLRFEQGKGVRQVTPVNCRYCTAHDLNDGKWHSQEELRNLEMP